MRVQILTICLQKSKNFIGSLLQTIQIIVRLEVQIILLHYILYLTHKVVILYSSLQRYIKTKRAEIDNELS